jgi:16S rRNA (guanine966-N2)-methyltransferase
VREATFARLGDLAGAKILDVYAGTGALGFEALSRGAESLVCIERARRCLHVLRANARDLGVSERVTVVAGEAVAALARLGARGSRFHLILMDPPYASDELPRALAAVREGGLLEAGGMVVIERGRRHSLPDLPGYGQLDERRYGDTVVARLEAAPEQGDEIRE